MVCWQKALIRDRNLQKMINLCKTIWTAIKTCRTLSAERGTWQSMGTTAFLIRKFRASRRRTSTWWSARARSNTDTWTSWSYTRWSHGWRGSWSLGSRRSTRWGLCSWTSDTLFYFCIKSLGPVWGRHHLCSKWGWSDWSKLFWRGIFAWSSASLLWEGSP